MSEFIAVGDIHGEAEQLTALLKRLAYLSRRFIFLGDYVDRGPQSRQVIDLLLDFEIARNVMFLCGNHDWAFSQFVNGGSFANFAQIGGIETIRSYTGEVRGDVKVSLLHHLPTRHRQFFDRLQPYAEEDEYLLSHAGYDPLQPNDRSFDNMVLASHKELFFRKDLSVPLVCGHYVQRSSKPYVCGNTICIDTGCGTLNGYLTAVIMPERTFVQVAPDLKISEWAF